MAEVLRSMTNLNSPNVASPPSPFENLTEEPSFVAAGANASAVNSNVRDEAIDFVTYESLGRSENQPENQLENMDSGVEDSPLNYSDDRTDTFPTSRTRQDSEQSSSGSPLRRFLSQLFVYSLFLNIEFLLESL